MASQEDGFREPHVPRLTFTALCLLALPALVSAQAPSLKPLRTSPPATISQGIGLSTVTLTYHRPAAKGRPVWGGLVPFGEVWRAGANDATTLSLSHPARIGTQDLSAGTYSLFILPRKDGQTWILNRQAKQWGAYAYQAKDDVLRVDTPIQTGPNQEVLRFQLDPIGEDTLRLDMAWAERSAHLDLRFDVRGIYWTHLEETLAKATPSDGAVWFQAANYCWNQGIHLDKAHDWVDISLKAKETLANLELKARLLQRLGKTREALAVLDKALALVTDQTPKEKVEALKALRETWRQPVQSDTICPPCME